MEGGSFSSSASASSSGGGGASGASSSQASSTKVWRLDREQELRFEVEDAEVKIKLLDGTAESFGTELAKEQSYSFTRTKSAIFTWHGCVLELSGGPCHAYIGKETPMVSYLEVHNFLEKRRQEAKKQEGQGPRVLIAGPTDTGKSSLCKLLISYASRLGWGPVYMDLDVGQGCTMPGMLTAIPADKPVDIVKGFDYGKPLVYFFGDVSPGPNPDLYKLQISNLQCVVDSYLDQNEDMKASGLIINTCGWVDGVGYNLLKYCIEATKADLVLVLDHERLYSDIESDVPHILQQFKQQQQHEGGESTSSNAYFPQSIQVMKLNKSGGVVTRDPTYRRKSRMAKIREYFYGRAGDLCPGSVLVDFQDVKFFRAGGGPKAPSSALPIGAERTIVPTKLVEVQPTTELLHSIVGVSYAKSPDALHESNVAGFVYITNINFEKRKIMMLAPCPGPLPGKLLLVGSLKWFE